MSAADVPPQTPIPPEARSAMEGVLHDLELLCVILRDEVIGGDGKIPLMRISWAAAHVWVRMGEARKRLNRAHAAINKVVNRDFNGELRKSSEYRARA